MNRLQSCLFAFTFAAACCLALSTCSSSMAQTSSSFSNQIQSGFEIPDRSASEPSVSGDSNAVIENGSVTESVPVVSPEGTTPQAVSATRMSDLLRRGGVLMIPIGICSLILLVFVFERFIGLRKARIIPGPFVSRVLEQVRSGELNRESAISLCERNGSAIANVFKAGFSKWGRV